MRRVDLAVGLEPAFAEDLGAGVAANRQPRLVQVQKVERGNRQPATFPGENLADPMPQH